MRPISKRILTLSAVALSFLGNLNTNAAEDLSLPPLPPPPPASGGNTLPAVPSTPAPLPTTLPAPAPAPAPAETSAPTTESSLLPPPPAPTPAVSIQPPAVTVSETFTPAEGGVQGRINGGRVNIRAGNSTKYEIILTANPDTPVTVFEKKGDWVTIAYPETEYCYISRQFIDGDIPADIPEQGLVRTIRGSNVNVRARPWPGSTVVGQVGSGDTVVVTQLRGQWAKVKPPASARAYVFHKYVAYDKGGVKETAGEPSKTSPEEYKKQVEIAVEDVKGQLQKDGKTDPILIKIRQRAEEERKIREAQRKTTQKIVESIDAQLERIEQESSQQIKRIYEQRNQSKVAEQKQIVAIEEGYVPPAPPGSFGGRASGWVEYIGYIGGRPAGFKLVKGGVTQYLIRSSRYDLNKFIGKRVLVSGGVTPAPAWEADVLSVDSLSLFGNSVAPVAPTTPAAPVTPAPAPTQPETRVTIDVTGLPQGQ